MATSVPFFLSPNIIFSGVQSSEHQRTKLLSSKPTCTQEWAPLLPKLNTPPPSPPRPSVYSCPSPNPPPLLPSRPACFKGAVGRWRAVHQGGYGGHRMISNGKKRKKTKPSAVCLMTTLGPDWEGRVYCRLMHQSGLELWKANQRGRHRLAAFHSCHSVLPGPTSKPLPFQQRLEFHSCITEKRERTSKTVYATFWRQKILFFFFFNRLKMPCIQCVQLPLNYLVRAATLNLSCACSYP